MIERAQLRHAWLEKSLTGVWNKNTSITALPADASFRRYFRVNSENQMYLLMDAPPELEDSHGYVAIAKAYRARNIHTPKIFVEDLTQGFLLIEDFGDALLNSALNENTASALYRKCYALLPTIQACTSIPEWHLPHFVKDLLETELMNFREWCLLKFAGLSLNTQEEHVLQETFAYLKNNAAAQPQVGVHRDYHSRNLMLLEDGKIGILDFQDAVIGPLTYDLVSLLRDCYISWPTDQVYSWVKEYYHAFGDANRYSLQQFQEWFDLQGLQRHLKAIFIFCRKYLRDGSKYYLDDIRRALNYTRHVLPQYPKLKLFHNFIENRLTEPLFTKIERIKAPS